MSHSQFILAKNLRRDKLLDDFSSLKKGHVIILQTSSPTEETIRKWSCSTTQHLSDYDIKISIFDMVWRFIISISFVRIRILYNLTKMCGSNMIGFVKVVNVWKQTGLMRWFFYSYSCMINFSDVCLKALFLYSYKVFDVFSETYLFLAKIQRYVN